MSAPRLLAAALALLASLPLMPSARADPGTSYTLSRSLTVPDPGNQQGLAWSDGRMYVGFDRGGGQAQVLTYDSSGRQVAASRLLPLGHVAELDVRQSDGNLYVATGGRRAPTKVNVVDLRRTPAAILKRYDFCALGANGMVAVDDTRDRMLVFTGREAAGRWLLTWSDWQGRTTPAFRLVDAWVPQGLEVVGDQVLYFASAPDRSRNRIRVLSLTGAPAYTIDVPVADEGEGLAAEPGTGRLHVGYRVADRVDRLSPVLTARIGVELLVNRGAESGTGGAASSDVRPVPGWTASGMSVLTWASRGTGATPTRRGRLLFAGGTRPNGTLRQVLPLAGLPAAEVDSGRLRATLSGELGGYRTQDDSAQVEVVFRGADGARVGAPVRIGPVLAADRGGVTGVVRRTRQVQLPVGTRTAEVVVTCTRRSGTNLDAYLDELSLTLSRTA